MRPGTISPRTIIMTPPSRAGSNGGMSADKKPFRIARNGIFA